MARFGVEAILAVRGPYASVLLDRGQAGAARGRRRPTSAIWREGPCFYFHAAIKYPLSLSLMTSWIYYPCYSLFE